MSRAAKIHSVLLGLLLIAVATGTLAFHVSSSTINRAIPLTIGHTTSLSVFRIFPETLRMGLEFRREPGRKRPEESPLYWHPHPDGPVTLIARLGDRKGVYAARPASGFGYDSMWRYFFPIAENGDPSRIPWPARLDLGLKLPSGFSKVILEVSGVGPTLDGETVLLTVLPPVRLKDTSNHPGYQLLWWFHLWPVFLGVTALYGLVVAWLYRQQKRQVTALPDR